MPTPAPTKIIFSAAPGKPLQDKDVAEILGRIGRHDELYAALHHLLRRRLYSAAIDAAGMDMSERAAGHAGGRISEISDLMGELASYLDAQVKK